MKNLNLARIKKLINQLLFVLSFSLFMGVSKCSSPDVIREGTPPIDQKLESMRKDSSQNFGVPHIQKILRNGTAIWQEGDAAPTIHAGETLTLEGINFGSGIL